MEAPDNMRDALYSIMKVCEHSSDMSRRVQCIFETAMLALGLTFSQRQERHIKALQRSEQYKEARKIIGASKAAKLHKELVLADTGEEKVSVVKRIAEEYI